MSRINKRWEQGVPHDPRSEAIAKGIAEIDYAENGDTFGWKFGGDGDNGEELMYLLDVYFEDLDAQWMQEAPPMSSTDKTR